MPKDIISRAEEEELLDLTWEAWEYEHYERSPDWYWALGIVALGLLTAAFVFGNFLFGVIILLGTFLIILYALRHPERISVVLSVYGVRIGGRTFPYDYLKSFWIEYDPPHRRELILESSKTLMPLITVHLDDADPILVREYLRRFLREKKHEESFITSLARLLRL